MNLHFTKMHGCGNDFIVIDNRDKRLRDSDYSKFTKNVCTRKFHIGANGLMLLEVSTTADFAMRYFNADGSEGEMCGNGARCIAKFAYVNNIAKNEMSIETMAGIYEATVLEDGNVRINFPTLLRAHVQLKQNLHVQRVKEAYHFATVGVPHTVVFKDEIKVDTEKRFETWARQIRYNEQVFPQGTNVNIVHVQSEHELSIRTYERGVEEETFACGSGATASAIIATLLEKTSSPVSVQTKGGVLSIEFQMNDEKVYEISLTGNAVVVYKGELTY